MSTDVATIFGDTYQDDYRKIVSKWSKKLSHGGKISDKTRSEWGIDLQESLGEQVMDGLTNYALPKWKKVGKLPSKDVLEMFSKIAAKGALAVDTGDLLQRLKDISSVELTSSTANPVIYTTSSTTNSVPIVYSTSTMTISTTEFATVQPPELIKRAAQTVSQIFDMAQDRFNSLMSKHFIKTRQITGKRRWVTIPSQHGPSRHASLNGEVRSEGRTFTIDGESVYGPRPPGGDPAMWSNCSCYLVYESGDGWI